MSIYRYNGASAIQEAAFRYANDRPPVALLTAAPNATAEQLSAIRRALEKNGWQCVPATVDGKEILQASGFKNATQLNDFLRTQHFTDGPPQVTGEAGDHPKRTSKQWLQRYSLKTAGVLNLLADVSFLFSGINKLRDSKLTPEERDAGQKEIATGLLYTAGGLNLAIFGDVRSDYYIRDVSERTAEFLKRGTGELPKNSALSNALRHKRHGAWASTKTFLYQHPSQITLGFYTAGAVPMLVSGIKNKNTYDALYGGWSTALKTGSLFIPEKKKQGENSGEEKKESAKAHGPLGQFTNWIREKPLRLFGYGSMFTEVLLGMAAYSTYGKTKKNFFFKALASVSYLLADFMVAISNKNPANAEGKFDADAQRSIEASVAETLALQPQQQREELVQQAAGFLATQPAMKGNADTIGQSLTQQIAQLRNNPWASRVMATEPLQAER